ncbi:hypothetical protein [Paenibacillus sp. YYML68]|uniref:hypothetical protein n=1 Tax=Paenibacillus sp. YYML68 TaxID=2909250 RepID=UPI0024905609|nr:hypothetical protein [Paenibacillus sp. YYML68]
MPSFVERYHQTAIDVKEAIVLAGEDGLSLSEIAAESQAYAGGPYAEKTLWRWRRCWEQRRIAQEARVWATLFHEGMDEALPRERRSAWKALWAAWRQLERPGRLLSVFLRMERSFQVTVGPLHPTKAGYD